MIEINLTAVANQSVSIKLEDFVYTITIKETRGVMTFGLLRDNVPVILGARILPNSPIIPYQYLENGNFVMLCDTDDYPNYAFFGDTQNLVYVSTAELEALRV